MVVVLRKYNKLISGIVGFCAKRFLPLCRILSVVYVSIPIRFSKMGYTVKVRIVANWLFTRGYAQCMMELVYPLCIHSKAVLCDGVYKTLIVQVKFNDQMVLFAGF